MKSRTMRRKPDKRREKPSATQAKNLPPRRRRGEKSLAAVRFDEEIVRLHREESLGPAEISFRLGCSVAWARKVLSGECGMGSRGE